MVAKKGLGKVKLNVMAKGCDTKGKGKKQLPKGWTKKAVERPTGATDWYYYSPEGLKFNSLRAVHRALGSL